jgi:hypothetical protein
MPSTTSATRSLSQRQSSRQAQNNTADIATTRQRCDYRRQVIHDKVLSVGARLLYVELDDMAGGKAEAWPKQQRLADRLGVCLHSIEIWIAELKRANHIAARKTSMGNRYFMAWSDPHPGAGGVGKRPASGCGSDPHPGAGPFIYEPGKRTGCSSVFPNEEEPGNTPACRCGGSGSFLYEDVKSDGRVVRKQVQCACTSKP